MGTRVALILLITVMFGVNTALADPPPWAGGAKGHGADAKGKGKGHVRAKGATEQRADSRSAYFSHDHRITVRGYYEEEYGRGKCPPGLAKKRNGCMPPGQAKKWRVGRPLASDIVYYDVAPAVVVKLGTPPSGHRFVRVAADILLIAIGTGMVVDAIEDLGRM